MYAHLIFSGCGMEHCIPRDAGCVLGVGRVGCTSSRQFQKSTESKGTTGGNGGSVFVSMTTTDYIFFYLPVLIVNFYVLHVFCLSLLSTLILHYCKFYIFNSNYTSFTVWRTP